MPKKAADAIEELRKAVLRLEDESGIYDELPTFYIYPAKWIPVTERLPENGAEVLAWSSSGFAYVDWWIDESWKVNGLVDGKHEFVSHWMPLPEPPKEET